jgi:hypothetical protein
MTIKFFLRLFTSCPFRSVVVFDFVFVFADGGAFLAEGYISFLTGNLRAVQARRNSGEFEDMSRARRPFADGSSRCL